MPGSPHRITIDAPPQPVRDLIASADVTSLKTGAECDAFAAHPAGDNDLAGLNEEDR